MLKGFKTFIDRGNVMDLAVGVVLGAAFGQIISSLVSGILDPLLGLLVGKLDFSSLFLPLSLEHFPSVAAAKTAGVVVIEYGVVLNAVIHFLIVAFALYLVLQQMARLRPAAPPPPVATRSCPYCLGAIPLRATRCSFCTSEVPAQAA